MIINRECQICFNTFTHDTHKMGKYPIYCFSCKEKYTYSSALVKAAQQAKQMRDDPLGYLDSHPSTPEPTNIIHPEFHQVYSTRSHHTPSKFKVVPLKDTFKIKKICEHLFQYASGEFNIECDGKLIKNIKFSIGANGFNVSAHDRIEEESKSLTYL